MNPYDQAKIDAIERDRKRREDELLLALLLIWDDDRADTLVALRHGYDYRPVLNTYERRAAFAIATATVDAHRDGVRRMTRFAGETIPQSGTALREWNDANAGTAAQLMLIYEPGARQAAGAMAGSIGEEIEKLLPGGGRGLSEIELKRGLRDAFDTAGYSATHPLALDLGAERAIVSGHNNGLFQGAKGSGVVTGLRHVSVIDDRTTDICIERDGLMLPLDDPYWLNGIPALHWHCRSTVLPVYGDFTPSDWRPVIPPKPGFGAMSAVFIDRLRNGLAA